MGFLFFLAWGWMMLDPSALGAQASAEAGTELLAEHLRMLATHPAFVGLFAVSLVGLVTVAAFPRIVVQVGGLFLRTFPASWQHPLMGFLQAVVESLQFLRSPLRTAGAVLLTMGVWLSYCSAAWCVARGSGAELSMLPLVVIQVIVMVAIILPQAPGFLGVFPAAAMKGAQLFGIAQGPAAAFALMLWAVHTMPITAVGLGCLWYEGLSLSTLARASRTAADRTEQAVEAGEEGS